MSGRTNDPWIWTFAAIAAAALLGACDSSEGELQPPPDGWLGAAGAAAPATPVAPATPATPASGFEWSSEPSCRAGIYVGTLDCAFIPDTTSMLGALSGGVSVSLSGPMAILLEESPSSEVLTIVDGDFSAIAQTVFGFRAKLHGELDCRTGEIAAKTQDGRWALGDPNLPLIPGGAFGAELHGVLDEERHGLAGGWGVLAGTAPGTCTGRWSAAYEP